MTIRFEISEIEGLQEVKQLLDALKFWAKHPGPALDLVGQRIVAQTKRHFKKQEGPDGEPWEPLKDATVARRRAGGRVLKSYRTKGGKLGVGAARLVRIMGPVEELGLRGIQILRDTGAMAKSPVYAVSIAKDYVEAGISSTIPYAATHQFGDPSRNIPARPFMYITAKEAQELVDTFIRGMKRTLEGDYKGF